MVIPLRTTTPAKFYGSSLPRPRFYVKPDGERVDPPVSVLDPFMSWAEEAHWSMGGLSLKRLRLQGKIEGNVQKLRSQRKKQAKAHTQAQAHSPISDIPRSKKAASPSPPPAPVASKRRRLMALLEEDEEEKKENGEEVRVATPEPRRRRLVKKLGDDFDRVASSENDGSNGVGSDSVTPLKTRTRRLVKVGDAVKKVAKEAEKSFPKGNKSNNSEGEKSPVSGNRVRTSPRLAKRDSN